MKYIDMENGFGEKSSFDKDWNGCKNKLISYILTFQNYKRQSYDQLIGSSDKGINCFCAHRMTTKN